MLVIIVFEFSLQLLWPNGVFFTRVGDGQEASDRTDPSDNAFQIAGQLGGMKEVKPSSFEQQFEASRRASEIKKFLFGEYLRLSSD